MDVLELVREINTNDAPVGEEQINIARQALLRRIVRDERAVSRNRRRWAGASVAIGGVAITVIAVSVLVPARVDPAAAAVLENAADVTINAVDTQLAPGQYLRIQTDDATLWKWDADISDPESRFNNAYRGDAEAGLVVRETRVLYVPADRSGDWIWDWSGDEEVIETFGTRNAEAVGDWTEVVTSSDSGYWPDIQRLPGARLPRRRVTTTSICSIAIGVRTTRCRGIRSSFSTGSGLARASPQLLTNGSSARSPMFSAQISCLPTCARPPSEHWHSCRASRSRALTAHPRRSCTDPTTGDGAEPRPSWSIRRRA